METNTQNSVTPDSDLDDDRMDFEIDVGCLLCDGDGIIITCIDDLCRGAGECMHGDGEEYCPNGCGL